MAWKLLFLGFILTGLPACAKPDLIKAFNGNFTPEKNNILIQDYCRSCHIHKEFDPARHLAEIPRDYRTKIFRNAQECRDCHYVEKDWYYGELKRKTRRPQAANKGRYQAREKDRGEKREKN
ncbi:MAG: hypothetical protein COV67_04570 [Nitrospinae bacterium CG11_big_fil_rev_8_21_14_0_20_56_8]|nr:MAG: hypothetical protein COV67_04570 [Nitrospinae bacterium CG11_big_fil_rev_8_21_14_0_20_56_8]